MLQKIFPKSVTFRYNYRNFPSIVWSPRSLSEACVLHDFLENFRKFKSWDICKKREEEVETKRLTGCQQRRPHPPGVFLKSNVPVRSRVLYARYACCGPKTRTLTICCNSRSLELVWSWFYSRAPKAPPVRKPAWPGFYLAVSTPEFCDQE